MRTICFNYDECNVMLDAIYSAILFYDVKAKEASKAGQYGIKNMFLNKKTTLESARVKIAFSEDNKQ